MLKSAAQHRNRFARSGGYGGTFLRIFEPRPQTHGQSADIFDLLGTVHSIKRGIDFRKIPYMRTVQNGCAELDWLR